MGSSSPDYDVSMVQSPEQKHLLSMLLPHLQRGFGGSPYDLPDPTMLQPTQDWYQNLSPEVMAGIRAPYEDQGRQLMETMGFRGMTGSPGAGLSGAAGVAGGTFAEKAARNMGLQAWQMSLPGAQTQYQAELGRNMAPWQAATGLVTSTFPTPVVAPQSQGSNPWGALGQGIAGAGMGYGMAQLMGASNPAYGLLMGLPGLMGGFQ